VGTVGTVGTVGRANGGIAAISMRMRKDGCNGNPNNTSLIKLVEYF
jgi:hypothetical protein